jgi:DNA-binding NtrC family response regulator
VLPIRVPALRDRREDIVALVEILAEDMAQRSGAQPPELSAEALALLSVQTWRGNIRELRNVLEQAAMRSDSHHIEAHQVELVLREAGIEPLASGPLEGTPPASATAPATLLMRPLTQQVAELEQRAIAAAMAATGGNKAAVAKMLGISRATLYSRLG